VGCWSGHIAAVFFFLSNVPQLFLNQSRRSTRGFSGFFVVIRTLGLSCHLSNGFLLRIPPQILLTGILVFIEHAIFLAQLAAFNSRPSYLIFILTPIPLFLLSHFVPESRKLTVWLNSASIFFCFIPYFVTIVKGRTTLGISLLSHHLSSCGSLWGLAMCGINWHCSRFAWIFYFQALVQSVCVYGLALVYHEFRIVDSARMPEIGAGETDILEIVDE
jgi:uncharacterized protein with PQ loop repeat